jgi:Carboxypeptidase regulatory-like domain/TonB dependent receptor
MTRSRSVFSVKTWSLASGLLLLCSFAVAQSNNGRILGTVTDQTGAVLAGAKVTIADTERGISRTLTSNEVGEYVAPNLQPGLYKITAEAPNFKKVERPAIRLEVAKDIRIDLQLTAGNASEVVTVTDEAPLVETTTDTLGGTFTNKAINDLPLNGRDFQNLVTLRPGVQRYPGGGFLSISSNGVRPEDNNFIIDGTDDNDPYYGGTVINAEGVQGTPATHMPVDAIQEFNALENPPAEYGWKPGAIVNVGLKSGTNSIHGSAFYFRRDRNFDARNFFNVAPAPQKPLRLNQYGATVGGPIKKDKLFYFLAFEGVGDLVGNSESIPSPNIGTLGGDPSNSIADAEADLATHGVALSNLSTSLIPLFPNLPGTLVQGTNTINVGYPNRNREDDGLAKVDYHLSDHHVLSGRYFVGDSLQTERDIPVLQPFWQSQAKTRAQASGANWTWTISNSLVNEAKFGFNRFWQTILTADANQDPTNYKEGGGTYNIPTGVTTPINFGFPEIAISGFNSLGGNHGWPLETTPDQTFQFTDNMSWTHGKHTIRFGGEVRHGSTDNIRDRYGKSRIRFEGDGAFLGSSPLEDFLAGAPAVGRIFVGNSERHVTIQSFGGFVQDDFRVTRTLTVNAGLRYDLTTPIKERNNLLGNFDPQKGLLQVGKDISKPYNTDANNFAPRLGISWDPTGKGKTVLRAGGGITYEIPHISIFIGQNGVNNATTAGLNVIPTGALGVGPGGTQGTGSIVAASTDTSVLNWSSAGPIFNANVDCSASPCNILGVNRNLKTPYITTWNFNIQQELTRNTSFQVGYVGTRGTKLYSVYDINQVDPTKDDGGEQVGRPFNAQFPYLGVINQLGNGYRSNYSGLQASLTQRAWRGLSFVAGYTWSHSLDQASLNRAQQPQDSLHPEKEYASSDIDIRQRFTLALSYELPGRKSFAQMLEGWQVNSIITMQSGLPWSVIDGFANGNDVSLTGEFSDRWDFFGNPGDFKPQINGIPYFSGSLDPTNPTTNSSCNAQALAMDGGIAGGPVTTALADFGCYAQGKAFMIPPGLGTFGTMGRNLFRGPAFRNVDFSIVKKWKFNERAGVQFRAELFNVLNHPNLTNPYGVGGQLGNVDPSVPGSFGASTATTDVAAANPVIGSGGPRAIQLGIKFLF